MSAPPTCWLRYAWHDLGDIVLRAPIAETCSVCQPDHMMLCGGAMPRVSSSAMYQVEWNDGTLSIWFHESGRYDYYNVPERIYLGLLNARSKGTYFNDHIREQYGR